MGHFFFCWKRTANGTKKGCHDVITMTLNANCFAPLGKETRKQNLLRLGFMGVRWLSQIGTCPFSRAWSRTSIRSKRETGFFLFPYQSSHLDFIRFFKFIYPPTIRQSSVIVNSAWLDRWRQFSKRKASLFFIFHGRPNTRVFLDLFHVSVRKVLTSTWHSWQIDNRHQIFLIP